MCCWLLSYFMDWMEKFHRKVERTFVGFAHSVYSYLMVMLLTIINFIYIYDYLLTCYMSGNVTLFLKKSYSVPESEIGYKRLFDLCSFQRQYLYTISIWRQSMYTHISSSVLSRCKSSGAWQVIFRSRGLYIDHMRRSKKKSMPIVGYHILSCFFSRC